MAVDPLDELRCPKGCDVRFIQYLTYEGTELRILEDHRVWQKNLGGRSAYVYTMGLRCAECGMHYAAKRVSAAAKDALDEHLAAVSHLLQDLADEHDDERLRVALLGETATIMEENRGSDS